MKISDVYRSLISAYDEWDYYLANRSFIRKNEIITWINCTHPFFSDHITRNDLIYLADSCQYSFQIEKDGSIVQIFYQYDSSQSSLINATLSFFCAENWYDNFVPWLRIDYSTNRDSNPLHHKCHMHISLFKNSRIPLSEVPSPGQFIEFIFLQFYPEIYSTKRINASGNLLNLTRLRQINLNKYSEIESDYYDVIPHFRFSIS